MKVVHGKRAIFEKMPGDRWQKFANLRLLYASMFAQPGKKLLFMGAEMAAYHEWNPSTGLDWWLRQFEPHHGVDKLICRLNRSTPVILLFINEMEVRKVLSGSTFMTVLSR